MIDIRWYNYECNTLLITFASSWNWTDVYVVVQKLGSMLKSQQGEVVAVIDLAAVDRIPLSTLGQARPIWEVLRQRNLYVILSGANPRITMLLKSSGRFDFGMQKLMLRTKNLTDALLTAKRIQNGMTSHYVSRVI